MVAGGVVVEPSPPFATAAQNSSIPVWTPPSHSLVFQVFGTSGIATAHTVVGLAAGVAQADFTVAANRAAHGADTGGVVGSACRMLSNRLVDARRATSRNILANAESGGHGGEGRERKDSNGCHFKFERIEGRFEWKVASRIGGFLTCK